MTSLEVELAEIADLLDDHSVSAEKLYARRVRLWKRAVGRGLSHGELARMSRVSRATVQQLIARSR